MRIHKLHNKKWSGYVGVDDPNGSGKYKIDDLFESIAGIAEEGVSQNYERGRAYWFKGKLYLCNESYTGVFDETKFERTSCSQLFLPNTDVQDAVDEWLEAHPEATTTVQDGSVTTQKIAENAVTAEKLSNELKLDLDKNFVTPEQFGAKGDGVTDDRDAFVRAFDSGFAIVGDIRKTYYISSSISVGQEGFFRNYFICNCQFKFPTHNEPNYDMITLFNGLLVTIESCSFEAVGSYISQDDDAVIDGTETSGLTALFIRYYSEGAGENTANVSIRDCKFKNFRFAIEANNAVRDYPTGSITVDNCWFDECIEALETKYYYKMAMTNTYVKQSLSASRFSHIFYAGVYVPGSVQIVSDCVWKACAAWPLNCYHTDDYNLLVDNLDVEDISAGQTLTGIFYVMGGKTNCKISNCKFKTPNSIVVGPSEETQARTYALTNCVGFIGTLIHGSTLGQSTSNIIVQGCNFVTSQAPLFGVSLHVYDSVFNIKNGAVTRMVENIDIERCTFNIYSSINNLVAVPMENGNVKFSSCVFNNKSDKALKPTGNTYTEENYFANCVFFNFDTFAETDFLGVSMAGSVQMDAYASYTVTFSQPDDGRMDVYADAVQIQSGDSVFKNKLINGVVVPGTGYTFDHWEDWITEDDRDFGKIKNNMALPNAYLRFEDASIASGFDYLKFSLSSASITSFSTGDGSYKLGNRNQASLLSCHLTNSTTSNTNTSISTTDATGNVTVTSNGTNPSPSSYLNGFFYIKMIKPKMRNCTVSFDINVTSNPLAVDSLVMTSFDDDGVGHNIVGQIINGHVKFELGNTFAARSNNQSAIFIQINTCRLSFEMSNIQVEYGEETSYIAPYDGGTITISSGTASGTFVPKAGVNIISQISGTIAKMTVTK